LLQRGKNVTVVVDAVGIYNKKEAKMALRKVEAKGARLVETRKLAGASHLRRVGVCDCPSCQGKLKKSEADVEEETKFHISLISRGGE
ncbi:MAG: hypothetical protein ACYST6_08750, partial [Planctomycetota bacterium]